MPKTTLSLEDIHVLVVDSLISAGATPENASSVARSTVLAERDGIRSHGLLYVPIYASHVRCGKVDGTAHPVVKTPKPGAIVVDGQTGFAHASIDAGWEAFTTAIATNGVAVLTVFNSYNCGVLGHHAERLAEAGYVGLCTTHAPASIAPTGGSKPVIGTNPFSLAVPDGEGGAILVIDQSASVIAKSEILLRSREQRAIEPGWALDREGQPTEDADAALKGSMLPAGGQKGFGAGLMVEILASCLAGAVLSKDASPFSGNDGGPPRTGQCFIGFDPATFSGDNFLTQVRSLADAITSQEGCRLPGSRRRDARTYTMTSGVEVPDELLARITNLT